MHRTRVALCLLLVFFCLASDAFSQTGSHSHVSLSGVLVSEVGHQPIANASVRLSSEDQSFWLEFFTSDSGEFHFQELPSGHFLLQIHAPGFNPLDVPIDMSSSSRQSLSLSLKPAGTPNDSFVADSTISVHELSMPAAARELVASGKRKFYLEKNPQSGLKDFQAAVAKAPSTTRLITRSAWHFSPCKILLTRKRIFAGPWNLAAANILTRTSPSVLCWLTTVTQPMANHCFAAAWSYFRGPGLHTMSWQE